MPCITLSVSPIPASDEPFFSRLLDDPRPYTHGVADKPEPSSEFRDKDEPVSLAPLSPEEALRALLAVKPEGKESTQGRHNRRTKA